MNIVAIMGKNPVANRCAISVCRACGRAVLTPPGGARPVCDCGGECRCERTLGCDLRYMLVRVLSLNSDAYGDKLVSFMDRYKINSLMEASMEMLLEFACESGYISLPTANIS